MRLKAYIKNQIIFDLQYINNKIKVNYIDNDYYLLINEKIAYGLFDYSPDRNVCNTIQSSSKLFLYKLKEYCEYKFTSIKLELINESKAIKMDLNQSIDKLNNLFKDKEWFSSVGHDSNNRLIVYTKFSCHETLNDIMDNIDGIQVLVHFDRSKTENLVSAPVIEEEYIEVDVDDLEEVPAIDYSELESELSRLEKICGANILGDIFFEIHDKHNSVTNLSVRFPEIRLSMDKLYNQYGFDVIYEELKL